MVCLWGSRLYGKVDEVPGLGYVSTEFLHLWYVPIYPLRSHLVFEQSFTSWHSLPMDLSKRSVLTAWFRASLIVSIVFLGIFATFLWPYYGHSLAIVGSLGSGRVILLTAASLLGIGFVLTKMPFTQQASYQRAIDNARLANAPEGVSDLIKIIYGQVKTKPEMAEIMARLDDTGLLEQDSRILSELHEYNAEIELLPEQPAPARNETPFG